MTDDDVFQAVRENIAQTPFHHWLRPSLLEVKRDPPGVLIAQAFRTELAGRPQRNEFHGGIVSALVDIAGHAALFAALGRSTSTVDLRTDYLRPAAGDLLVRGNVIKLGKTLGLVDIWLDSTDGKRVAVGRAVYFTG